MKWNKRDLFWILMVLIGDRVTKFWAINYGWWQLNHGGVFGVAPGDWWFVIVSVLVLFLVREYFKSDKESRFVFAIMIASGCSNLADRLLYGGVVDFIVYPVFGFVGNVADIWLSLGVIILIVQGFRVERREKLEIQKFDY